MINVSEVKTDMPKEYKSDLQEKVYKTLKQLDIKFERVDTDEAITMEDCAEIDKRLDVKTVKTLFLCNRQKTDFYLYICCGDKSFSTKNFSKALGISRVSFAPIDMMPSMLGTHVGATTVFSAMLDSAKNVTVVF